MPDIYKAIKALTIERECVSRDCDRNCGSCGLAQDKDWLLSAYDDALKLLKGQKPVKPYLDFDGKDVWTCGNCNKHLFHLSYTQCDDDEKAFHKYCGYCGRAVKWYA